MDLLKEYSAGLNQFFEATSDLFCIADLKGRIIKVNKGWEKVLGYSVSELEQRKFLDLTHPDYYQVTYDAILKLEKQNKILNYINRCKSKDGTYKYLEWSLYLWNDLMYASARDITGNMEVKDLLDKNKENFLQFFNNTDDFIIIADTQGRIVFFNQAARIKLGYRTSELLKMDLLDLYPIGIRKDAKKVIGEITRGETTYYTIPLIKKDGSTIPVKTHMWYGKWGHSDCLYGISRDLTAQQASLDKFKEVFDHNPEPMILSNIKTEEIIDVNEAFLKISGFKKSEIAGKTASKLGLFADSEKQQAFIAKLKKEGRITGEVLDIKGKNGKNITGAFSGGTIGTKLEKCFLIVMSDPTTSMKPGNISKKEELSYKKLAKWLSSMADLSFKNLDKNINHLLGVSGKLFSLDRAYIFLFSDDEIYMSKVNEWCADKIEPQKNNQQDSLTKDMPWWIPKLKKFEIIKINNIEELPPEAENEKEWLKSQSIKSLLAVPLIYKSKTLGFFGFDSVRKKRNWSKDEISILNILSTTISNTIIRLRVEEEALNATNLARLANNKKNIFLNIVSHEIKTPLSIIQGYLDLFSLTELTAEQLNSLSKVRYAADILRVLVDRVFDVEKIEANKLIIDKKIFDFRETVNNAFEYSINKIENKGLEFKNFTEPGIPEFLIGDPLKLQQIFTNLIDNSIKFTIEGFISVNIIIESQNDSDIVLCCSVSDSGIGMTEKLCKRVFNLFTQEEENIFGRSNGILGLGLYISKSIVKAMGGSILLESKKNSGTKVSFTLSFKKFKENKLTEGTKVFQEVMYLENANPANSLIDGPRVLLAEDDELNGILFLEMLKKIGINCDLARNGAEAVKTFKENAYDLVFLDCQMPVMNGLDAARQIRVLKSEKDYVPIIALTAHTAKPYINMFLDAGMDDFICKPVGLVAFKDKIDQHLNGSVKNSGKLNEDTKPDKNPGSFITKMGFDKKTGEKILLMFVEQAGSILSEIKSYIKMDQIKDASFYLHKLKGSAGNIGAMTIFKEAKTAEKFIENGDDKNFGKSIKKIEKLINGFFNN